MNFIRTSLVVVAVVIFKGGGNGTVSAIKYSEDTYVCNQNFRLARLIPLHRLQFSAGGIACLTASGFEKLCLVASLISKDGGTT